jgi:hypothetical protein
MAPNKKITFVNSLLDMKKITSLLLILFLAVYFQTEAQTEISTRSLLKEMTDLRSVTYWPDPNYSMRQSSSYDRKSLSADKPGWFANGDQNQFIKTEISGGHTEYVMMESEGPGAIVRFWLTTFKRTGIIRIYFDHEPEARIMIPEYDLMKLPFPVEKGLLIPHSSYQPLEKGGSTLYLPMPYAKHCKITFEASDSAMKQPHYYQINYRTYSPNTKVKTFSISEYRLLKDFADQTSHLLLNPMDVHEGKTVSIHQTIPSKKSIATELPSGSHAIQVIYITLSVSDTNQIDEALRSTILKLTFDQEQTVWCPIGDFSGSGFGGKPLTSWYRTVDQKGRITIRWIMPYQKTGTIRFENLGPSEVHIDVDLITKPYNWTVRSMYFHTNWKFSSRVPIRENEKEKPIEWEFNKITGKGIFMGDCLAVYNRMHCWYGEGDQKLYSDEQNFPAEFGTGTEDYYNTSWAPVVLYQSPFANAPRADTEDSYGHNTFTRTRNLDGIPFTHFFRYDLEMLGWRNGEADIAATTYWYGFKKAASSLKPMSGQIPVSISR